MSNCAADQIGDDLLRKPETDGSSPALRLPFPCNADMWVEIELSQDPASKRTRIEWSMSDNYPTSTPPKGHSGPILALYQDDELLRETSVDKRAGVWFTDQPSTAGLDARVYDWDCQSKSRFLLCKTPPVSRESSDSVQCRAHMSVQIDLSMDPASKCAQIEWNMSDNYPTSTTAKGKCGPSIDLYMGDECLVKEHACPTRKSMTPWITEVPFAPGLSARIFDWDCQSRSRFLLCKTDPVR